MKFLHLMEIISYVFWPRVFILFFWLIMLKKYTSIFISSFNTDAKRRNLRQFLFLIMQEKYNFFSSKYILTFFFFILYWHRLTMSKYWVWFFSRNFDQFKLHFSLKAYLSKNIWIHATKVCYVTKIGKITKSQNKCW